VQPLWLLFLLHIHRMEVLMREHEAFLEKPLELPLYRYKSPSRQYRLLLIITAIVCLTIPYLAINPILTEIFNRDIDKEVFSYFFDFRGSFVLLCILLLGRWLGLATIIIASIVGVMLHSMAFALSYATPYFTLESVVIQLLVVTMLTFSVKAKSCDTWISAFGFVILFNLAFHWHNIWSLINATFMAADIMLILVNWVVGASFIYFIRAAHTSVPVRTHQQEMDAKWERRMQRNNDSYS